MKITVDEARAYFAHKSQQLGGITPETLPEEGFIYYADGHVCGVFHRAPWPDVYMAHYGVKPEGWGNTLEPSLRILNEFWNDVQPERIIGWTPASNKRAIAFAKRLGFVRDGEMPLNGENLIMQGWTK